MKKNSLSIVSDENSGTEVRKSSSQIPLLVRKPFSPLQPKLGKGNKDEMVGKRIPAIAKAPVSPAKKQSSGIENSPATPEKPCTSANRLTKVQAGFIAKRKKKPVDRAIQTDADDIVTGDTPTLDYWKELANERRVALEEALKENQRLVLRVEELESENKSLEEMVEDAKALAEMVNAMASDDADESGIGRDEDTSANASTSFSE